MTATAQLDHLLVGHERIERPSFADWMKTDGRRHTGEPLDPYNFPHIFLPGGPAEALDDPAYTEYAFQWATRLGKTTLGHQLLLYHIATGSGDTLFASATEKLANRNRDKRFVPIARAIPSIDTPRSSGARLDFDDASLYFAWSGSDATLGDLSARVVFCSEVDKWSRAVSTEADPLRLAAQRAKEFVDRKVVYESTPSVKSRSRIEKAYERSTKHRLFVPCPHCGNYQVLKMGTDGDPKVDGGLIWDKPEGVEHSDPDYARITARYCCAFCHKGIQDYQRPKMMRSGVWAGDGQTVDRNGEVEGELLDRTIYGSQLSSLYAMSMTWGEFAYRFLTTKNNATELQDFVNGDLGETFSDAVNITSEDDLISRLVLDYKVATVPEGVQFLTAGIDLQEDRWVWVVYGWGVTPIGRLINYGETENDTELVEMVLDGHYDDATGRSYKVRCAGFDSGFMTEYVYSFCDNQRKLGRPAYPLKGMVSMRGKTYNLTDRAVTRGTRKNKRMLKPLIGVNTNHWQEWIQRALDLLGPDDEGGLAFPIEMVSDRNFFAQMLNEGKASKLDRLNYTVDEWQKIDPHFANDFRDATRYARVTAEVYKRASWGRRTERPKRASNKNNGEPYIRQPTMQRFANVDTERR